MRVDLLCSGSKGNACLVRTDKTTILIDCGKTKSYLLEKLKEVDCQHIDACLITHGHGDHISQFKWASQFDHYQLCDLPKFDVKANVQAYESIQIGDIACQILPLSHDYANTMGLVLVSNHQKLVYVTDTGFISQNNLAYMADADAYVMEFNHDIEKLWNSGRPVHLIQRILSDTGHLNNEDAAYYLSKLVGKKTKQIVLAHLSEEANSPSLALAALAKRLPHTLAKVVVGQQNEVVSFSI